MQVWPGGRGRRSRADGGVSAGTGVAGVEVPSLLLHGRESSLPARRVALVRVRAVVADTAAVSQEPFCLLSTPPPSPPPFLSISFLPLFSAYESLFSLPT